MTREEAIKILKSKMDGHTDTSYEWAETVRMAIKALEQEPRWIPVSEERYSSWCYPKNANEPCSTCEYCKPKQDTEMTIEDITDCLSRIKQAIEMGESVDPNKHDVYPVLISFKKEDCDEVVSTINEAFSIIKKYQKIQEIVRWNYAPAPYYKPDGQLFREIIGVLEDG